MKRILINRLIENFEELINNWISQNEILEANPPFTIDIATFNEFKEYVTNALKQLKSKMMTLTIVVGNSNYYTCYSVSSGKSKAVESGYGFMGIVGYKIIFKW
jgi:hypothetical protein